jgi:hypothetical protein
LVEHTPFGKQPWKAESSNGYFNKTIRSNSKGVFRFSKGTNSVYQVQGGVMQPKPLGIQFDFSDIGWKSDSTPSESSEQVFKKHKIKGYFITRQKRIPNIIAQGLIIGHTKKDFGSLPVLMQGTSFYSYPFLNKNRLIQE